MIRITSTGDFGKTKAWMNRVLKGDIYADLDRYGRMGVAALAKSTPVDSSATRNSWSYRVIRGRRPGIEWYNSNMAAGTSVAILIQYGHGTGTGGYVAGRDYINPAMRPIFDQIAADVWKKVMA